MMCRVFGPEPNIPEVLASTNKCLAQTNKSRTSAAATKNRSHQLWPQQSNLWRGVTSPTQRARRLRSMTTILRKYHSVARCTLLGELIEDTATRYYYRLRSSDELTFVDKQSPAIHLTPCPACPDWPAGQQRGSAVGMNSR